MNATNVPPLEWLKALFATLLATMNGDEAWEKFRNNVGEPILGRCRRLNIIFPSMIEPEPALDDVGMIPAMEQLGTIAHFPYEPPCLVDFAPVSG
jgi:hypothetical protein